MNLAEALNDDLLRAFVARWRLLLVIQGAFMILALVLFVVLPRQYKVTATVMGTRFSGDVTPSSSYATFTASSLLSRSTNSLPAVTDFNLFSQLLTSPELGSSLVDDSILESFFPMDRRDGVWVARGTLGQTVMGALNSAAGQPAWRAPDGFAISALLERVLKIDPDKDTQMLTITYVGKDPAVGKRIISLVQGRADLIVKRMAQARLRQKVTFLQKEIAETSVQETRMVLANTLAKAQTDRVLSFTSLPFAAEFLSPPAAADKPDSPGFFSTLGICTILGFVVFFLYLLYAVKFSRPSRAPSDYGDGRLARNSVAR